MKKKTEKIMKKFHIPIVLILVFIAMTAAAFAQEDIRKLNLDEAVSLSLENNLDLQSARIKIELAKNDIKTANRLQNPEVNVFYNYGSSGRGNPQQIGTSELIEIGKRSARKKLAQANLVYKEKNVQLAEFTLEMDVRETYVNLVSAKTVLNRLNEQKELLEELYNLSMKQFKAGKVPETDVIQAQIALNQMATQLNSAKTEVRAARHEFNKALNVKDNRVLYDSEDEILPSGSTFISLKTPKSTSKMPSFEEIAENALNKRLDIRLAKQEVEIAQKNLTVIARQRVPDIEFFGGYAYQPQNHSDSGFFQAGAYAGANLQNIPLFYQFGPEIKNAKLQIDQAQINYESAKNKAMNDLSSAYDRFLTSKENLNFYEEKLIKESEQLISVSKKNYASGKTDLTSLIVMEQSYKNILVGYTNALALYYTDWIDFLREVNSEDFEVKTEDI